MYIILYTLYILSSCFIVYIKALKNISEVFTIMTHVNQD